MFTNFFYEVIAGTAEVPMEEHGVCRIVWCENGEKENSREMEVGY